MSSLPVRARRIFQAQLSRSCKSCQRATPRRPSIPFPKAAPNPTTQARIAGRRYATTSTTPPGGSQTGSASSRSATGEQAMRRREAYYAPSMETMQAYYRRKNLTVMNYVLSVILATAGLSYGSVPLYKMICTTTGWGGQPVRVHTYVTADGRDPASRMVPVTDAKRIKVTFAASVSDVLPWKFVPQQRDVKVLPGETALAFYKAYNNSDKDIIGVATYSVTPAQVAPYFSKIQCFCFEEQRLNAHEEVDMPVFFYLDPDLLNDINMKGIETVTLHYTFFKARYDDNGRVEGLPKPY